MRKGASIAMLISCVVGQKAVKVNTQFADMDAIMKDGGYDWEAYKTKTEDGWYLNLFRVMGKKGQWDNATNDKLPILVFHGATGDATGMAGAGHFLKLVDAGYEVWFGDNRGNYYSNEHEKNGSWGSLRERWDFSWADMGLYDVPAFLDAVIEVNGKPKVTVIGYSQGTS